MLPVQDGAEAPLPWRHRNVLQITDFVQDYSILHGQTGHKCDITHVWASGGCRTHPGHANQTGRLATTYKFLPRTLASGMDRMRLNGKQYRS